MAGGAGSAARGVYAAHFYHKGQKYNGVANLGVNPTFEGKDFSIEVHVLGFSLNIYGKEVRVDFLKRLRDEKKFKSIDDLRKAISKDIIHAEKIFAKKT